MAFFNPKEEVIDIELTQYGKNLLTRGKFKPAFYAFFDNDVIYDSTYAGFTELQNDSEKRIQNQTPRTHTQYVYAGIEENITKLTPSDHDKTESTFGFETFALDPVVENEYALGVPLGNSSLNSDYAPSWNVEFLYGKIDDYKNYITGSSITVQPIPQLEATVEYESFVTKINPNTGELVKNYIPDRLKTILQAATDPKELGIFVQEGGNLDNNDLKVLQIKPDFLLLEILEENTDYQTDNFDIEVFIIEEEEDKNNNKSIRHQRQLFFYDPKNGEDLNTNHVEYYFDLDVDKQIIADYFCAADIENVKRKSILADGMTKFDCPDISDTRNIYAKKLEDIEEPC